MSSDLTNASKTSLDDLIQSYESVMRELLGEHALLKTHVFSSKKKVPWYTEVRSGRSVDSARDAGAELVSLSTETSSKHSASMSATSSSRPSGSTIWRHCLAAPVIRRKCSESSTR